MPLVIDAYNLLHAALGFGRDLGVEGLARLISSSRFAGQPATLVCDGHRNGAEGKKYPHIRVVFAGSGLDADSIIEHIVARDSAPRRLVVVSSDRRVQAAGKRRRCTVYPSEAFLAQLLCDAACAKAPEPPSPREQVPLGAAEVAGWISAFGDRAAWAIDLPSAQDFPPATVDRRSDAPVLARQEQPRKTVHAASPPPADPLLDRLLAEFPSIARDDLDMARWLGERRVR